MAQTANSAPFSEAIAGALLRVGASVLTYVPGTGANEVFKDFNRLSGISFPVSFNEEVAYTIAHGASLSGTRSASLMKAHGFLKAANSISDSLFCGTGAGLCVIIFNDPEGKQSDSIPDIEGFVRGIGIPYARAELENVPQQIFKLFEESEKWGLPQALIVESGQINEAVNTSLPSALNAAAPGYQRDITRHVLCPFFTRYQKSVLDARKSHKSWSEIERPSIPRLPDSLPPKWKAMARKYAGLFSVFKNIRGPLVTGDTGVSSLFACEPYNCVDITTYLGGSIPLGIGAYLAGFREVWALSGDFAFIGAGHMGLPEALQRQAPLKVLIFDNCKAETTGGQEVPEDALPRMLRGYQEFTEYIRNPSDHREVEKVLTAAKTAPGLRIVVANYREKH